MANLAHIDQVTFHQFIAQQVLIGMQQHLSREGLKALENNSQVRVVADAATDSLAISFTAQCLAGRIDDAVGTETVQWPDGAWQMFKQRHLPWWFQRRFPIRYIKRVIETRRTTHFVCPHIVSDPTHRHVAFMATGTPSARYFKA